MNQAEISKVLLKIQSKANGKFHMKLFKEVQQNEEILFVIDEALKKDLPDWKRKYYKVMRKEFDVKEKVEDEEIKKELEEYVEKEIKKAVDNGLLPKEYVPTIQTN